MAVKKTTKAKKGIKKKFYEVDVPMISGKVHLYSATEEELEGRIVKIDLTRSLKGRSFELKLRVSHSGKKLVGEPRSLVLISSYVRRMMRKGVDYVEDSFVVDSKDAKLRIKPILITRNRVSRAVRRALRDTARKYLEGYLKTRDARELFDEIMTNKLQRGLNVKLKKIYPLGLCEIRSFEAIGDLDKGSGDEDIDADKKE